MTSLTGRHNSATIPVVAKVGPILAAVALAGFSVAFSWKYLETYGHPVQQFPGPVQSPLVPPMSPHFRESLASGLSNKITEQVMRYRMDHGKFPPTAGFWRAMEGYCEPLYNPLNGSDEVVPMMGDFDSSKIGWVYDEHGVVYPGVVFNRPPRPSTRPE
jgi:hypothetical protein